MNVAVLMGGPSSEREISLRSGVAVADGLRASGHTVSTVDAQDADFRLPDGTEVVFIALHGAFGEDGGVQRELRRRGMPFTGSDEAASRLAFDKRLSKQVFERHAIPTPAWEIVRAGERPSLPWPVVVKPPCQGSTIGIHRVNAAADWNAALDDALQYDAEAIVETFIDGRELTVGLLDGIALAAVEIVAPNGWYDFEAKYVPGNTFYQVPAALAPETAAACRELALSVYNALGCRGLGRVDLRMQPDGRLWVLEMNTIPGFTATSLLPKAARQGGIEFPELCERVLRTARV